MRPHWWRTHPLACTCADCNAARLRKIGRSTKTTSDKVERLLNSLVKKSTGEHDRPYAIPQHGIGKGGESPEAKGRARPKHPVPVRRNNQRRRGRRRLVSPVEAVLALAAGAMFGVLFLFPFLPDSAAEVIVGIQDQIAGIVG